MLRSGVLNMRGSSVVREFEAAFGRHHRDQHAFVVANGTVAIHLALRGCGIGPGDQVVVPTHTFVGSVAPILYTGATPVFVDVDEATHCLSAETVEPRLTSATRAVIVVHLNGYPVDLEPLRALLEPRGIVLIEDCAQALGSSTRGEPVGTVGLVSTFSFFEQKIITAGGEGGAVVTGDPELAARIDLLRQHSESPRSADDSRFWSHELGYNYRLSPVQTAVLSAQFERLDSLVERQRRNAAAYTKALQGDERLALPVSPADGVHSFWRYPVRILPGAGVPAAEVADRLRERGVPSRLRYPFPVHVQPPFADPTSLPVAEALSDELITIPVHATMNEHHVSLVVEVLLDVLDS